MLRRASCAATSRGLGTRSCRRRSPRTIRIGSSTAPPRGRNRVCCDAALSLLFSTMDGGAKSPVRNSTDAGSVPLYALGEAIGQGGNGIVMDATKGGGPRARLRVPLDSTSTEELPSLPPRTTPPPQGSGSGANGHDSSSKPRTPRQSKELMGKEKVDTTPSPPSQRGPSSGGDAGAGNANLAVKVVRKGQASMQKVLWEVHVLRQLMATPHQHIVRLLDVIDVVDACYLIMERVDGPDLLRWISEQPGGVLPIQKAQRVFAQMCSALRHAHRAGFVHCDVKPENIKLHPLPSRPNSEHAVLLDWGYARRIGLQSEPITQGTPAYAAPEQLTGYQADGVCARASLSATVDVWSLGATLCEMLSGQPPFSGASFEQLVSNVLALNLNAACRRMISDEPRQLIEGMLQIHPSDRYTVDELCRHDWVKEFLPDVDEVEVMLCGEVDEDGKTGGGGLLSRLAPSASLRRSIMMECILCSARARFGRAPTRQGVVTRRLSWSIQTDFDLVIYETHFHFCQTSLSRSQIRLSSPTVCGGGAAGGGGTGTFAWLASWCISAWHWLRY